MPSRRFALAETAGAPDHGLGGQLPETQLVQLTGQPLDYQESAHVTP
jgi:hypothetical protein